MAFKNVLLFISSTFQQFRCFPASLTPLGRLSTSSQVVFPFAVLRDGLTTRSKRFPEPGRACPLQGRKSGPSKSHTGIIPTGSIHNYLMDRHKHKIT